MASFLRLSPVVVCFIAGAVLQNFPGQWKEQVRSALARVERPVYLLFLLIAGALWRVDEWQGWALMLAFVAARLRELGEKINVRVHYPRPLFCTDNGAMIAYAGALRLMAGQHEELRFGARPRWTLSDLSVP